MHRPTRVAIFGEAMLELRGGGFGDTQLAVGGDTLNTAIYLSRCGAAAGLQVAYATALGDDPLSDDMLRRWQTERLDVKLVRRLPGRLPGLYMISLNPAGERSFSYWREQAAARDYFQTPDADTPLEAAVDDIDVLYLSGISLAVIGPAGRERLFALMARLRHRGAGVVFDNNYRPRLWPDCVTADDAYDRAYALASTALVTLDDEQARRDDGASDVLARLMDLPTPELVIKRGAEPTIVRLAGQAMLQVPTQRVPTVVDTTAAGDSFAGAYLAARLSGASPAQAAQAGNRLAARVVQHAGAVIPADRMADLMAGA